MSGRHQATAVDDEDDDDDDEFMLTPRTRDRFGQGYSQYPQYRSERPSYPVHRPSRPRQRTDVGHNTQQRPPGSRYGSQQSYNDYNSQRSRENQFRYQDHRDNYNRDRSYDTQYSHNNRHSQKHHNSQDNRYPYDRHYPQDQYNARNTQYPRDTNYSQYGSNERYHPNQRRDYGPPRSDRSRSTSHSPHTKAKETGGKDDISSKRQNQPDFSQQHTVSKGPQAAQKGGWLTTSPEKNKGSTVRDRVSHASVDRSNVRSSIPTSDSIKSNHRNTERQQSHSSFRQEGPYVNLKVSPKIDKASPKYEASHDNVSPKSEVLHDSKAGFKKSVSELLTEKENRSAKKIRKRLSSEKHEQTAGSKKETENHEHGEDKAHKPDKEREPKQVNDPPSKLTETAPDKTDRDRQNSSKSKEDVITNEKEKPCDKTTENRSKHKRDGSDDSKKMIGEKSVVKNLMFEIKSRETAEKCVVDKHKQSSTNSRDSSREKKSKYVERKTVDATKLDKNNLIDNLAQKSRQGEGNHPVPKNERNEVLSKKAVISDGESNKTNSYTVSRAENKRHRNQSGEKYAAPNVTKSGPKRFADSSGGYRVRAQDQSSSVDKAVVLTSGKEQSKVLKQNSTDSKDKKSQPTLIRQISNSSSTSVESAKTNSSRTWSVSCSRSERKTSSEISTFDFAGDIFQDSVSKHEAKTSTCKLKSDKFSSVAKSVPETPAEQLKDKSHKHKQRKDDNSRNEHHKHKHKKSAVVGSDSSGTDAEFEHFKNILTQVHDSRWKTKPLESDSRRSSTQSHKSTDSSVSVSLLNPQKEIRILSKKAYKKFGVRNVEYRGKKMYYKGIKIKQPQVFIRKKDIQKVIKHRRNLKLRKKLDKAQKSKFKRIRRIGSSTPESDMRDSDKQFVSVVEESDTGLSSTGDQVKRDEVDEGKEFSWIVPDSFEESASISSDQRKKSHKHESYKKKKDSPKKKEHSEKDTHVKSKEKYHKERKKFVSPPKKKINSGVSNRNKEETDGSKWKTERSRVKSDIVSETKTEGVLGSKRKETPKMKMDSDLETNAAELIKTDICISSTSSSDESLSEAEHKRKIHFYRKERKEIPSRKTKASSSPIFKQTSHKAKSKTKSPQKRCKSSLSERGGSSVESQVENSENGMKNKTIKKDINKSAIVQETESSNSSSDTLAKNDGICDKGIVSPVVKSCEIVLTKINDRIETKVADDKDVNKKTFKETVKDPTEIPETQMSPSSTSSSDLPIFKDSPIELDNNTTVISYDKSVHDHKDNVGESEDKTEINECNNSTFSTQETQLYSCGDPVLNTRKSETQSKEKQSFDYVTNDTNQNEDGVKTEDQTDENDKVDNKSHNVLERSKNQPECTVSRSSDNGHTDEVKSNPLKKCLSPKDKIKQSFKSFQSKFMKYQQKQRKERKLKSKIITKKLKDRGLLSDKDETGEEGDIEDNLLFESSETDDSDVEILTINKNKHIQKEVSTLNLCMRENAKLDNVGKDEIQPFNIMSMSENENSDISVVGKPKEGNKTRDRSPDKSAVSDTSKDNKTLSKKSDKFVKSEPMEDKGTLNEVLPKSPLFVRNDSQNLNIQSMSENEDSDVSVLNKPREGTRTLSENSDKAVSVEPKEHINKPLTLQKKSSEPQIDKTTAQIEPESNDIVTKVDDVKIKVEEDNDKGDVRYESFTSSCSQCSSSSDVEIEKENVSILGREEIKTEKEDVNISTGKENVIVLGQEEIKTETEDVNISNIEGYRWMSTHGKELQIKQNFRNNEGSNEVETKETEENKDEKPRLSSLINNQSHSIKQEISEVEPESNTNMDHVKEEPVQIKDEPDWSKFSYTQEPDAIFVSDSEDNGNEIMSAQNETILVNSDSEDNDNTLTNQSAYDSQVLDPEFWDFSSPEIYSSSEDDVKQVRSKANDTLKASPLAGTSNVTVKHEKIETVDKSKVVKDEDLTADTDNEKITDASESVSYSCSDSSCDESEYVEIGSSDSEKEEDSTLNIVEILDDSASSVQNISSERLCNTSVTESYTTHTVKDSFDPYSVATQIAENLPSNSRAQAISEATKTKLKPHLKFLNESSSENESPFPHGSDKNSEKIKKDFAYDDLYEAYTQVDGSNCQEMRTYQEPVQVSAEDEFGQKESEDIELDNLDSFSDSSLVDAADNQIKLYEQSRKYPHKTKIVSAAGLIIKCDKNVFASNKEVHKIKKFNQGQNRDLEVPVSNETFKADNDWYSTMTQVDAPNHGKEPAASTPKENRKTAADEYAAYGASTQVDNEAFGISSENESDKNDEIDAYANMTQIDKAYSSRVSDDKVHKKNETEDDYYAALTQKDAYVFSSDSDNVEYNSANIQVVKSVTSKSMDYEKATRNAYNMETQIDYESQGTTDISLISLTDSDQSNAKKISEKDGGKIHLIQKTAKQSSSNKATVKTNVNDDSNPVAIPVSSNKDKEKDNKLNSIKEKLKLSLSKKKTIEIPMQKTNSWKMARQLSNSSSIVKSTSKRNDSSSDNASESVVKNPPIAAPKQSSNVNKPLDDIAFYNAKSSDMWLSKNTSKPMKTPTKPPGKRKRRATGEAEKGASFSSAIQEARKRLADRNYQTVLHPEMKADPQKKPKLDRPAELEDVDLPSCSQIVSKGLPILNQTGLLVKKNKPQHQVSSRFSSRAASLTETMMETASESAAKHQTAETDSAAKHQTAETASAAKRQTTETALGSGTSAVEFLEKEISNLKHLGSDKSEKDKSSGEKVEDSGTQRKRRLSTVSQKSEYMPDPKTAKKRTSDEKESIPSTSEKSGVSKQNNSRSDSVRSERPGVYQPKTDRKTSKEEDSKPGDSAKPKTDRKIKTNSGVSEKPGVSKPKTARKSSREEDPRPADSAKRKDADRKKTIEKAAKMTDITNVPNEKSPEPKSKPVWNASSVEKHTQKKAESTVTEKVKKRVTFGENIRYPAAGTSMGPDTSKGPVSTKGPETTQKSSTNTNQRDPRPTKQAIVDRPNLMLKTPIQSSDALRPVHSPGTTLPQLRPPPLQPVQRQNQVPAPATALTNQVPAFTTALTNEMGISFKEFLAVMLRWNPVWFEEHANLLAQDRNSEPPNCINGLPGEPTLFPLLEKYNSFKEYSNNFMIPLLLYETWESCFQTWRERRGRNNLARHQMCLGGVNDAGDKLNDFVLLGLLTEGQKRQNQFFTEGDLVMLRIFGTMLGENNQRGEYKEQTLLGLVERVFMRDTNVNQICSHNLELAKKRKPDSFSVKVILKTRKRKFSPDYKTLGELTQVGSVVTTLRQFRALECLPRNPLCRDILWPTNNDTYCDTSTRTKIQTSFNPSQQKAIMTAALMVSRPSHKPKICLLQGPPGTGKSHTILGIINQILEDKQQKARICLCAQSHAAIDELLRRLSRQNKQLKEKRLSTVKLVRVGKSSSVHEDVRHLCLENLVEKNVKVELTSEKQKQLPQSLLGEKAALEKKILAIKAEIRNSPDLKKKKLGLDLHKLERQRENLVRKCQVDISREKATPETLWKVKTNLIGKANVIAGTLSGIGSSALKQFFEGGGKEKGRQGFDCIIIDEATQAIELDTLIPLQYGTTKLILVGDPEQLPPTVVSQVAVDNRFNLSLFERLNSHFRYSNHNPVIMLDTQYRMDPEICYFPSTYIYDGKLKTDRSIYGRSQCPLEPYLLYDIADGREQLSQCSGSVSNPAEALFTVSLVEFIVENTNVTANVIGIIAPYQKQKSLLVTQLQDSSLNGLHEIEVSTVDGFQGREKHVIIMSCVRAKSSTGTIGFVGNRNRMNVALTRAKYALYVIAHFDSLERNDEWKPLIEDANARNRRIPVTERNVSFALAKCMKRNRHPP